MYTYATLTKDIARLNAVGAEIGIVGYSLMGNKIFYAHVGPKCGKQIIITGGIHARENVTSALVVRQAFRLLETGAALGFYFVPMVNPDGALLIEKGAELGDAPFLRSINGSDNFSLWKANARGVDLNVNFDAKFGQGKGNVFSPAPHGYVGTGPFSEPETMALRDFTLKVKPAFTISYHALGREVYWEFGQKDRRDKVMATSIADYLGYRVVDGDLSSAGGYKDWCVTIGIPAVTIEIGSDAVSHPIDEALVEEDIIRNLDLPSKVAELYNKIYE